MPPNGRWGTGHKLAFRFAFTYFVLYLFPFSTTFGWFWSLFGNWEPIVAYETLWRGIVPWVGAQLGHPITVFTEVTGGSDTTYEYVRALCYLIVAAVVTVGWSALDRERPNYFRLHDWLRVYLRLVLASAMLSYGAGKVIPTQMPPPSLTTLLQPFGDLTPYRLSWSFIGASSPYQVFAGVVEMSGGVLLLVPGLTTLGALVSLGAAGNVLMLNLGYGIPVKFWALHLALCAGYLVLSDGRRLINAVVLNRTAEPPPERPLFDDRWANRAAWGVQWAIALSVAALSLSLSSTGRQRFKSLPVVTPLYGIWRVEEFAVDGEVRPPLLTDPVRWQRVVITSPETLTIQAMDGSFSPYALAIDTAKSMLRLKGLEVAGTSSPWWSEWNPLFATNGAQWVGASDLAYDRGAPDRVTIHGAMNGHQLRAVLAKEDRRFALETRAFRWISDEADLFSERAF